MKANISNSMTIYTITVVTVLSSQVRIPELDSRLRLQVKPKTFNICSDCSFVIARHKDWEPVETFKTDLLYYDRRWRDYKSCHCDGRKRQAKVKNVMLHLKMPMSP